MMREIIEVPFPLAASRRLMSFLTFQISIYCGRGQPLLWLFLHSNDDGRVFNFSIAGQTPHKKRKEEGQ